MAARSLVTSHAPGAILGAPLPKALLLFTILCLLSSPSRPAKEGGVWDPWQFLLGGAAYAGLPPWALWKSRMAPQFHRDRSNLSEEVRIEAGTCFRINWVTSVVSHRRFGAEADQLSGDVLMKAIKPLYTI